MCVFENSCCTLLDSDVAFRGQSYSLQDSKGAVMQIVETCPMVLCLERIVKKYGMVQKV